MCNVKQDLLTLSVLYKTFCHIKFSNEEIYGVSYIYSYKKKIFSKVIISI